MKINYILKKQKKNFINRFFNLDLDTLNKFDNRLTRDDYLKADIFTTYLKINIDQNIIIT